MAGLFGYCGRFLSCSLLEIANRAKGLTVSGSFVAVDDDGTDIGPPISVPIFLDASKCPNLVSNRHLISGRELTRTVLHHCLE